MFLTAIVFAAAAATAPAAPRLPKQDVIINVPCYDNGQCAVPLVVLRAMHQANEDLAAENDRLRGELDDAKKTVVIEKKCGTVTIVPNPTAGGRS